MCDLYQSHGSAETVHIDFIERHYYGSHANLNPARIIPIEPDIDYWQPHYREKLAR